MKKPSQADRLLELLSDGLPHSTPDILASVYGSDHAGIARIASRVTDLRERGHEIESWPDKENKTVWFYQLINAVKLPPRMVPVQVMRDGILHIRMVPEGSYEAATHQ